MSAADDTPPAPESAPDAEPSPVERELILDLNFVPAWARKPPSATSYFQGRGEGGGARREDRFGGGGRDRGRPGGGAPRGGPPGGGPGGAGARRGPDDRRRTEPRRHDSLPPRSFRPEPEAPPLPLEIRFLPDDRQLAGLIKRMRGAGRAYPLAELVSLFLSNPDACRVKLESLSEAHRIWQCKVCGMIALDRPAMESHLADEHFAEAFDQEQHTGEAPTGNFVCVARCGLSGVLLGPPNHNTYTERIQEVHRARYAHMPLAEYRRHIETLHDAEQIEAWKESSRTQTLFRRKGAPAESAALKWSVATDLFLRECAPAMMRLAAHASLPASLARKARDERLTRALAAAWNRECRHPRALPLALQGALRGRHFYSFRAGQGERFITAIEPAPLNPAHAIDAIRDVLTMLREKPGCTRTELVEALRPGHTPESPEAADILKPLGWLVERGHIIEFYNGTLAVPRQ